MRIQKSDSLHARLEKLSILRDRIRNATREIQRLNTVLCGNRAPSQPAVDQAAKAVLVEPRDLNSVTNALENGS